MEGPGCSGAGGMGRTVVMAVRTNNSWANKDPVLKKQILFHTQSLLLEKI